MRVSSLLVVAGAAVALLLAASVLPGAVRRNAASRALLNLATGAWCDPGAQDLLEGRLLRADAVWQEVQTDARLARLDALRSLCGDPARAQMEQAARLTDAAAACAASQDWACAAQHAAQAVQIDSRRVQAQFILHQALTQLGDVQRAQHVADALAQLTPEYRLATAEQIGGWSLAGFDLDEHALEFDERLNVTLFWQVADAQPVSPPIANSAGDVIYRAGRQAFQVVSTPNLVINGGFEITDTVGDSIVLGFAEDRYQGGTGDDHLLVAHRVRVAERNGRQTLCAELDNTQVSPTGYVSDKRPAAPGELYLLGALAMNAGDGTKVGMLRQRPADHLRNAYVPQVGTSQDGWAQFAGVMPVLGDTAEIALQLLNQDVGRAVCFDNAFLLRLSPPVGLEIDNGL